MSNPNLESARLLLEQGNLENAIEYARRALADDPEQAEAYAILALCQQHQSGQERAARDAAAEAVRLAPDTAFMHYVQGAVAFNQSQLPLSERAFLEAERLDPQNAETLSALAWLYIRLEKREPARTYAHRALELDPESVPARAAVAHLLRLGEGPEAAEAFARDSLRINPHDAHAHVQMGWAHLNRSKPDAAMDSFREALRLNPDNEAARAGVLEALKAQNFLYRIFLAYAFWLAKFPPNTRMALIVGLWFAMNVLSRVGETNPALSLPVTILWWVYLFFAFSTWTLNSLFNVLLVTHPIGRYALRPYERNVTLALAGSLTFAAILAVAGLIVGSEAWLVGGGCFFGACFPLGALANADRLPARLLIGAQVAVALATGALIAFAPITVELAQQLVTITLFTVVGGTWVNGFLLRRER